jgi:anaerobic selenocysteine-containing dehydrogenase
MKTIETACTYDCPDACALLVELDGEHARIHGNPAHPVTRGFVCRRIKRHLDRLSDPGRVTAPLVRNSGRWKEINWIEALDLAAGKLARAVSEHGAPSVLHLTSGGSLGIMKELVGHFFRSLGPVTTLAGGVCDETGVAAQALDFGDLAGHDFGDLANSRAIVLWGKNPAVTGIHLVPFLRQARARGTEIVLIDLLRTQTAAIADRYVNLAPGADGFLALAVLRRLYDGGRLDNQAVTRCENFSAFEKMITAKDMTAERLRDLAGVELSDIDYLAELYAQRRPLATLVGWGLQRRAQGGASVRCIDALGMLSGNVGIAGGGVSYNPRRRRGLDAACLVPRTGRTLAAPTFASDLSAASDPPICFAYINGANPVAQFADSRAVAGELSKIDFVVLADAFLTDTADCADLFLPVSLMLEDEYDAVGSFAHHYVARTRRALAPPAGVRDDVWIVAELARRLGHADPLLENPRAALDRMTARWFPDDRATIARNPVQLEVPFAERFATSSGKMRLIEEAPLEPTTDDEFPLFFLTPKRSGYEHSQISPEDQKQPPICRVNPGARGAASLDDGQFAKVVSPLGSLSVRLRFDPTLRPDICLVPTGGWLRLGRAPNALVSQQATDMGQGTAFYDQHVRLEPVN